MAAAVDDGDIGTTNGNNDSSGKPSLGDQDPARDHSRLREQLDKTDPSAGEIAPGAPLAPPPVFFATGAAAESAGLSDRAATVKQTDLPAGDRRSRAFRWTQSEASLGRAAEQRSAPEPRLPSATAVSDADPLAGRLTVVSGGEHDKSGDGSAGHISPSAAAALGDLVAAMIGPLAGGL